jgi:peptidoglycan/LPS O-acetylase OafA/YrhL
VAALTRTARGGAGVKAELRALTSARGIAAWLVVLYHIRGSIAGLSEPALRFLAKGYLAVDFFFLLSGFVIWLSWHERVRAERWAVVPAFLQRRIARVWPLHVAVLAGGVALVLMLAATGRHDPAEFPFAELPLHLLLVQNWGFTDALAWNDPAWSISAEMGAYLLFPVLALAVDWRRVPSWAVLAVIAALFAVLAGVMSGAGADDLGDNVPRFGLLRCVVEFAGGTAVCALWVRWRGSNMAMWGAAAAPLGLFAAYRGGAPELVVAPAAFAALLLALALSAGRARHPLEGRVLHYLGEVSYATYLGHYLLWFAFKLVFVDNVAAVGWPLIALYLAMVLASSVLLYHLVERPAQRWINRLNASGTKVQPAH